MFDRQKAREIWDMSIPGDFISFDNMFPEEDGEISTCISPDGEPYLRQGETEFYVSYDFVRRMIEDSAD